MNEQPERVGRGVRWDSGDAYEPYVGRWSRLVAREFVKWLAVRPGSRWLDVGCGTGALIQTVLEYAAPSEAVGIDPSAAYIAFVGARMNDAREPASRSGMPRPYERQRQPSMRSSPVWFSTSCHGPS
jgi:SAM-dependent methyltransferase